MHEVAIAVGRREARPTYMLLAFPNARCRGRDAYTITMDGFRTAGLLTRFASIREIPGDDPQLLIALPPELTEAGLASIVSAINTLKWWLGRQEAMPPKVYDRCARLME